jgi:hypothetical protein
VELDYLGNLLKNQVCLKNARYGLSSFIKDHSLCGFLSLVHTLKDFLIEEFFDPEPIASELMGFKC